jgi:hypothetical protein
MGKQKGKYDGAAKKIDAIRAIRADLVAAGTADPKPMEIWEVYKDTKWSVGDKDKDVNYISSTLSQIRKGAVEGGVKGRKKAASNASEPGLTELLKVKELVKGAGGMEKVAASLETVSAMAGVVGGLPALQKTLEALRQLSE